MKLYVDDNYCCHTTNHDGIYTEVETAPLMNKNGIYFFANKCNAFIEGYRYIPEGKSWTRSDGAIFFGEMISPWKNYAELDSAQREYERQKLNEYNLVLQELGVEV